MKRSTKIVGTLSLALVMTSAISPIYAEKGQEPLIIERSSSIPEHMTISTKDSWEDKINYINFEGVVKEIKTQEGYVSVSLTDGKEDKIVAVFNISDEAMIVDQATKKIIKSSELKEGKKLAGYYRKDMPMLMIYPPIINPELVIVKDEEEKDFIKHSNFDEELISADNSLKLNISEETVITNQYGEECKEEELYDEDLVVFYTITTRSIPAQTNPSKIIVLKEQSEENTGNTDDTETGEGNVIDEIAEMIKADSYKKEETVMIPLRKIAEHLGYQIEWNNENRSIILSKGNVSFTIAIGKEDYGYNKSLRKFEQAPEINNEKTYVPQSLLDIMK
ncbi:copper amine oxidase N-terminal domain-containing protein [Proteiniborus sp. MB09-C3]|uniref:copper amine oxidase N-terminal domain-containing protein n=1 Tax=Proteiniborus sp. MB09-C3 TaxID=3050072 RepID=UPI002555681B|nr:copper amine oxidase N-terminal domain-containing protein [Proteiniborus sp. MB09-C3]WIV13340.1 copper amine oxidase N-terminal domain-containing protein [Proteiniborus sp. MB09-C3]